MSSRAEDQGSGASTGAEGNPEHDPAFSAPSDELSAGEMLRPHRPTTTTDDVSGSSNTSTTSTTSGSAAAPSTSRVGALNIERPREGPPYRNDAAEIRREGPRGRTDDAEIPRGQGPRGRTDDAEIPLGRTDDAEIPRGQGPRGRTNDAEIPLGRTNDAEIPRGQGPRGRTDDAEIPRGQGPRGRNDDDKGLFKLGNKFLGLTFQAALALMIYRKQPQEGDSSSANPSLLSSILFTSVGATTLFGFAFAMSGMLLQKHHSNVANFCSFAGVFLGALGFFLMMDVFAGEGLDWLVWAVGGVLLLVFAYTLRQERRMITYSSIVHITLLLFCLLAYTERER